jgi:hypothetical protein
MIGKHHREHQLRLLIPWFMSFGMMIVTILFVAPKYITNGPLTLDARGLKIRG